MTQSTLLSQRATTARSPWRLRLLLVALGLLLPLLLLEVVLQLLGPIFPGQYQLGTLMVPDPSYGHYHARDTRAWVRTAEYAAYVRTNRFGHRGADVPAAKPSGTGRVLLLGDSFVEAKQVPESKSMAGLLQNQLGAGGRCQVMNSGVAAWGTGEEYVYLREEGKALQPDLVVVFFYIGNDLGNNVRKTSGQAPQHRGPPFRLDAEGRLVQLSFEQVKDPPAYLAFLRRYSWAFGLFETGVLTKLSDDDVDDGEDDPTTLTRPDAGKLDLYAVKETSERRRAWQVTEALLTAIRDESAAAGARMAVVAIPATYQTYDREWRRVAPRGRNAESWERDVPNRQLAEIQQRLGVPYLDLLPTFYAAAAVDPERLYFPVDAHWTVRGNQLAADEVQGFLAAQPGLLPAACS